MIKLNVGGNLFTTSKATLTSDPGSMLHAMFSGRFETKPSEDGSYFIDRDGTHFRYILNYLRTGQLVVPEDNAVRKEVLVEAEFYRVEGIINELRARPFKDSLILSSDQRQTLIDWLKDTLTSASHNCSLLYRTSRDCDYTGNVNDQENSSRFHSLCDCKGPTVTVIKCKNNVFGGYTEQQWEKSGHGTYRKAPDSFLFSLVNSSGLPPTKIPLKPGKEEYAIYCHSNNGPTFGNVPTKKIGYAYGHDLWIGWDRSSGCTTCTSQLNSSYQCPTGQDDRTFLTSSASYENVSEMEVFGFEK